MVNTSENVEVRLIREQDKADIIKLQTSVLERICAQDFESDQLAKWKTHLADKIEHPDPAEVIYIAAKENKVIGCICEKDDEENIEINWIAVDPSNTRKKVGTKLVARLERRAKTNGKKAIHCTCGRSSVSFFKANGFQAVVPIMQQRGSAKLPMMQMVKSLESTQS